MPVAPLPTKLAALLALKTILRENPITATVATTATLLLEAQPARLSWTLVNLSVNNGRVSFNEAVAAGRGIFIAANGGSISAARLDDGDLVELPVYALNETASGTWYIVEVVAEDVMQFKRLIEKMRVESLALLEG